MIYFETLILARSNEIAGEGVQTLENLGCLYQPAGGGWQVKYIEPELDRRVKVLCYFSSDL